MNRNIKSQFQILNKIAKACPQITTKIGVGIGLFYLVYMIEKLGGKIYYKEISGIYKALFIDGFELDGEIYNVDKLEQIGKDYLIEKGYPERIDFKYICYYGMISIIEKMGYKICLTCKNRDLSIKSVKDECGNVVSKNTIVRIAKQFYQNSLRKLLNDYDKGIKPTGL